MGARYEISGATCADLEEQDFLICLKRDCDTSNRALLASSSDNNHATLLEPGDELYGTLAKRCGHVDYDISLIVDHHFSAVASPSKKNQEQASSSSCPVIKVEANFLEDGKHYQKVTKVFDQQDADLYVSPELDSLFIGTFKLEVLRLAHESVDPTKSKHKAYDVINYNCADFMISLAKALDIKIDSKITSYVTRRLIQEAGQDLVGKIRDSIHFDSLFFGPRKLTLRAAANEPSDDQVIQALVEARTAEIVSN
jgi:hypothetical protein